MSSTIHYTIELERSFITRKNAEDMLIAEGDKLPSNIGTDPYYHQKLGLFLPLVSDGQVIAYLNGPISSLGLGNGALSSTAIKLCSEDKSLRLLPQTVKALKSVPSGSRMTSNQYNGYSSNQREGLKIRSSEVLKAVLLGYLDAPSDDSLITAICNSNYDLRSEVGERNGKSSMSLAAKTTKIDKYLNGKNSSGNHISEWHKRPIGKSIGYEMFRSSKEVDAVHEIKWRKPAKTSVWPWTMDHHWFEVQESPITMANYAYKALLTGSARHKINSVNEKYPVFNRQLTMDHGRKVLELFFNEALKNKAPNAWGSLNHILSSNMEWVVTNPYYAIPKLCIALGVVPKFNQSGVFEKFVPLPGNIVKPSKKVYIESSAIDVDNTHKLEPMLNLTMMLCYEVGLISLETLEKSIGLVNAGEALGKSDDYVHVAMGKHVVCCIPKSYSYDAGRKQLMKVDAKLLASQAGQAIEDTEDEEIEI